MKKYKDRTRAKPSEKGTASHNPFISNTNGNKMMVPTRKTKVLEKDMIAEIFPLDKEVNNILEKVLKPTNSKAIENNLFPVTASGYALLFGSVKIFTNISEPNMERNVVVMPTIPINKKLSFLIFCIFSFSPEP